MEKVTYSAVVAFKNAMEEELKKRASRRRPEYGSKKSVWRTLFENEPKIRYGYLNMLSRLARLSLETITWLESSKISIGTAYNMCGSSKGIVNEITLKKTYKKS